MNLALSDIEKVRGDLSEAQENARQKGEVIVDLQGRIDQLNATISDNDQTLAEVEKITGSHEGGIIAALRKLREELDATAAARGQMAELERGLNRYRAIAQDDPNYQWVQVLDDRKSMRM